MSSRNPKAELLLAAVVLALTSLSGCINFGSVKDFAAVSQESAKGFSAIVDDMYGSCMRAATYDPDIATKCAELKQLQPRLLTAHAVLEQYMGAMGKLAGDQVVSYDENLGALESQVNAIKLFKKEQASAVTGLAKFLAKIATDGYRRKKLTEVIQATNGDIQVITDAFKNIVGADYARILQNEEITTRSFYMTEIHTHKEKEPLAAELAERILKERIAEIQKRKDAAVSYIKIMETISRGHQELFEHRKDLGSKELMKLMWDYARTLAPLVKDMKKAF